MKNDEYQLTLKSKEINYIFNLIDSVIGEFESSSYRLSKYRKFKNRLKQTIEKIDKNEEVVKCK